MKPVYSKVKKRFLRHPCTCHLSTLKTGAPFEMMGHDSLDREEIGEIGIKQLVNRSKVKKRDRKLGNPNEIRKELQ